MAFLLFGLGILSFWKTYFHLRGIRLVRWRARPVFAGDRIRFTLQVNTSGRDKADVLFSAGPDFEKTNEDRLLVTGVDLLAHQDNRVSVKMPSRNRGWACLSRVRLTSGYPLGMFQVSRIIAINARCLVYPKPLRGDLSNYCGRAADEKGEETGPGMDDFKELSGYQPGDPPQRIAWKASSRGRGMQTKHFQGTYGPSKVFDFDAIAGDTEHRLRVLCAQVLDADREKHAYALKLPGRQIEAGMGEAHKLRSLRALALFHEGETQRG